MPSGIPLPRGMRAGGQVPLATTFRRGLRCSSASVALAIGAAPKWATSMSEVKVSAVVYTRSFKPGERDGGVVPLAKLGWNRRSPWLPESVQHANQGAALAKVVVQVEQLEAAKAGRAQAGLDLFLVAGDLEAAGGMRNLLVLRQQAMLLCGVAHDLVVTGNHVGHFYCFWGAGEGSAGPLNFLMTSKSGIGAPLANLVADDGIG